MQMTMMEERATGEEVMLEELTERLDGEIGRLERMRRRVRSGEAGPTALSPQEIQRELQFLRQLRAGLACSHPGSVWYDRAGFGSVVHAREESGRERFFKLVSQRLDPLDAAQVSLGSELGQALLGRRPREQVWVGEGSRRRRVRIATLKTLPSRLRMPAPRGPARREDRA